MMANVKETKEFLDAKLSGLQAGRGVGGGLGPGRHHAGRRQTNCHPLHRHPAFSQTDRRGTCRADDLRRVGGQESSWCSAAASIGTKGAAPPRLPTPFNVADALGVKSAHRDECRRRHQSAVQTRRPHGHRGPHQSHGDQPARRRPERRRRHQIHRHVAGLLPALAREARRRGGESSRFHIWRGVYLATTGARATRPPPRSRRSPGSAPTPSA
jgi:hypothetical protein